jgi:hypothetical protein
MLQSIHKFAFMEADSGWIVKDRYGAIRLSGNFGSIPDT